MFETFTSSLPFDVLPTIFKRLSVHDRKNVRLTCRLWNDVCNREAIIADEKFVFRPDHVRTSFLELGTRIAECRKPRSYWEFQGLRVFMLPSSLWKRCGPKIRSIFTHSCEVDDATIYNLITFCTNLEHLRLLSPSYFNVLDWDGRMVGIDAVGFNRRRVFCSEKLVSRLVERRIVRERLVSLELYFPAPPNNETLRKLFRIFPRVRKFGQGHWSFRAIDPSLYEHQTVNEEDQWVLPSTIESFISNRYDINDRWRMPDLRFKEFSTMLALDRITELKILEFFSQQTDMEKLRLYIAKGDSYDAGKEFLIHILKNMPKLKELEIHSDYPMRFIYSSAQLCQFLALSSRLESFVTNGFTLNKLDCISCSMSSIKMEYTALRVLHLGRSSTSLACQILGRCCRPLEELVIEVVNDPVMQTIFQNHAELRTLRINLKGLTQNEYGAKRVRKSVVKYPFKKLRNLRLLRIIDADVEMLEVHLSEFEFPKLRYFDFYSSTLTLFVNFYRYSPAVGHAVEKLFGLIMEKITGNSPYLEILRLRSCMYRAAEFAQHFKKFKMTYLRFMIIDNIMALYNCWIESPEKHLPVDWNFGNLESVFAECPSLRVINFLKYERQTFCYDQSTKVVKRYPYFNAFNPLQP